MRITVNIALDATMGNNDEELVVVVCYWWT